MENVGVAGSVVIGSVPRVPIARNPWKSSVRAAAGSSSSSSSSTLAASRQVNEFLR